MYIFIFFNILGIMMMLYRCVFMVLFELANKQKASKNKMCPIFDSNKKIICCLQCHLIYLLCIFTFCCVLGGCSVNAVK